MGCIGPIDGKICMCPNCHKTFKMCNSCGGKPVKFDKPCPGCGRRLTPETVHFVGNIVEGELFYYTCKGEGHALHISKCRGMLLHNRDGVETGGFCL